MRVAVRLVCLLALAASGACEPSTPAHRPDVILVVLESVRAAPPSCSGRDGLATNPAIDRLAQDATRFTRAFATDVSTLSSHATLLTGLYPRQARATSETGRLPEDVTTLAERLQAAGYRTMARVESPWISTDRGFAQGFERFIESWRDPLEPPPLDEVLGWIRDAETDARPSFLFLSFGAASLPFRPSVAARRVFVDPGRDPSAVARLSSVDGLLDHLAGRATEASPDLEILGELYCAALRTLDGAVAAILAELEGSHELDDTLVILTADRGANLGEQGLLGSRLSWHDRVLKVPLVMRYPHRFAMGALDEGLTSLRDVTPTILDVAGIYDAADVEARSLCSSRRQAAEAIFAESDRPLFLIDWIAERDPELDLSSFDRRVRVVRTGRHKMIWKSGADPELYDLRRDPGEHTNLAGTLPMLEADLKRRLKDWNDSVEPIPADELLQRTDPRLKQNPFGKRYVP